MTLPKINLLSVEEGDDRVERLLRGEVMKM